MKDLKNDQDLMPDCSFQYCGSWTALVLFGLKNIEVTTQM